MGNALGNILPQAIGVAMGMLRIVSNRGDERRLWNEQDALAGDAEALRRFEKQNGSLHERAPGARRLFVSKRANR